MAVFCLHWESWQTLGMGDVINELIWLPNFTFGNQIAQKQTAKHEEFIFPAGGGGREKIRCQVGLTYLNKTFSKTNKQSNLICPRCHYLVPLDFRQNLLTKSTAVVYKKIRPYFGWLVLSSSSAEETPPSSNTLLCGWFKQWKRENRMRKQTNNELDGASEMLCNTWADNFLFGQILHQVMARGIMAAVQFIAIDSSIKTEPSRVSTLVLKTFCIVAYDSADPTHKIKLLSYYYILCMNMEFTHWITSKIKLLDKGINTLRLSWNL